MSYTALTAALLAVMWTQVVHSNMENRQNKPRITIDSAAFKRYKIGHTDFMWKLVKDPISSDIYAGGPHGLYKLKQDGSLEKQGEPNISLLTDGKNGTLFICEKIKETENENKCCFLNSKSDQDCFSFTNSLQINEPSLLVDRTLFFTKSSQTSGSADLGLYKQNKNSYLWPHTTTTEAQKYIKIITNEDNWNVKLAGKLYSFQTVKNPKPDPETPLWISQVSQYCMADKGGSKSHLQYHWTSMLTARLFCGNKEKRMTYAELLDVTELKTSNDTMIYALFKNVHNNRAVCVYKMSEITRIFDSSKFRHPESEIPSNPIPGQCIGENRPSPFLNFMEKHPEMEEWIEPERDPLLFHCHFYSHLQVDRVNHQNVLLMTLESGRIHKVLEKQDGPFIIAEYRPFEKKNHIHSMVLDRSNRKLYVTNSSQVVQIDLQNCSQYGADCKSCVMAEDPYCSWSSFKCSPATGGSAEGLRSRDVSVCESPSAKRVSSRRFMTPDLIVPHDSKYYLTCSTLSKHASYTWIHDNNRKECVSTDEKCVLLIESMSKADEGLYECEATEDGQSWTISSYSLVENGVSHLRVAPAVLTWLLLLICVIF